MTGSSVTNIAPLAARSLLLLGLAIAVAACSGGSPPISDEAGFSGTGDRGSAGSSAAGTVRPTKQSAEAVSQLFNKYSVPDQGGAVADYRVAPMDVLEVTVYDAPNLSRPAQVSSSGMISLPLIGDVRASGKTTDQLQADIAARLRKDFMQSPQVFVTVKEYNSQRVTVDGAVAKPGVFPLKGETTLVEVIAQAGGLSEMGSPSNVYVLRKVDGKKMAARFDLNEIRKGQKDDPVMHAGDIVMVDESGGKVMLKGLQSAMGFTGLFSLLAL
ncbi:MAG: polysaccharide export protein [Alphaproteobacteria bacterium]|uniref:polysaccharide biosynthesis/export family protein n=1 Tax=Aestuariivirga sp. TaxID=2650926 RepID=UPI00301609B1|nr:polysaccharide export protein [Alphaproteobacteria bacterium]